MSEGCRKITRGTQGHEILVQTHEENAYALLCTHQRHIVQADN